jgi:cytoskeleton protein RodZ
LSEENGLTLGRYLRQEREKKGVSLDSVVQVTRITRENLEALERDDFQAISAPVFVRGFLRSYANYLGLDPKELVSRYDSQTDLLRTPRAKEAPQPSKDENPVMKYLVFLCILLAGVAFSFYYFQKSSLPPSPLLPSATVAPAPIPVTPSPAPAPAPVAPPPAAAPAPVTPSPAPVLKPPPPKAVTPAEKTAPKALPPEKEKKPAEKLPVSAAAPPDKDASKERRHVLKAVAGEKTWMRVLADEQQTFDVLLQPKETATWTARRRFEITLGNAGGIALSLNGVPQGPLGKAGEVVHLVLPKETIVTPAPKLGPAKESPPPKVSKPAQPESPPAPSKDASSPGPNPSTAAPVEENMPSPQPASKGNKPSPDLEKKESKSSEAEKEAVKNLR